MKQASVTKSSTRGLAQGIFAWLRSINDLFLAVLFGMLVMLVVYLHTSGYSELLAPVRAVFGMIYFFIVPGYAMQAALFPSSSDINRAARVALATGLSVSILPVLVLVLDWLPWGIRLWPALIGLNGLTLLFSIVTAVRRGRGEQRQAGVPALHSGGARAWWSSKDRTARWLYAWLVMALVVALGSALALVLLPRPDERFTEFYILGDQGLGMDYPREAVVGQPVTVKVGLHNLEGKTISYRFEVRSGDQKLLETGAFEVSDGETREGGISFALPDSGENVEVQIFLYRGDQPEPYRELHLWVKVLPPS
jgi:uncharacterized membrane protein